MAFTYTYNTVNGKLNSSSLQVCCDNMSDALTMGYNGAKVDISHNLNDNAEDAKVKLQGAIISCCPFCGTALTVTNETGG